MTRQNIACTIGLRYTSPQRGIARRNSSAPTLTLHTGAQTFTFTDNTTSGSGSGSEAKNTSKHKHKSYERGIQNLRGDPKAYLRSNQSLIALTWSSRNGNAHSALRSLSISLVVEDSTPRRKMSICHRQFVGNVSAAIYP